MICFLLSGMFLHSCTTMQVNAIQSCHKYDRIVLNIKNNTSSNKMIALKNNKYKFRKAMEQLKEISSDSNLFVVDCYEIILYNHGTLVKEYVTDGHILIDQHEKKIFKSDVDLLYEYWGILEENACQ